MSSEEKQSSFWISQPQSRRDEILSVTLGYLMNVEDVSLEQSIQRCIDSFGCLREEVIEALRMMSEGEAK